MEATLQVGKRAAQLRRDFDSSFVNPPPVASEAVQDLLAIRLGTRRFAIRLSEIAGLYADKKITPVPGAAAGMLGIAGFRGSILPVYDLQDLLDLSSGSASRWLVVAAGAPVAFSFAGAGSLSHPAPIASQKFPHAHIFIATPLASD